MLRTISGRHSLHALYVDTILNEKRGSGEKSRYYLWVAWLRFIEKMASLPTEGGDYDDDDAELPADLLANKTGKSGALIGSLPSKPDGQEGPSGASRRYSYSSQRSAISATKGASSTAYFRNLASTHILASSHPGKIILESGSDPVDARESIFSGSRLSGSLRPSLVEPDLPPRHSIVKGGKQRTDTMSSIGTNSTLC